MSLKVSRPKAGRKPLQNGHSESPHFTLIDHPLIQDKLSILRHFETGPKEFGELVEEIGTLMVYELTRTLPLETIEVQTPLEVTKAKKLSRGIVLIPILRAGLGMVQGIRRMIPTAKVGHVGVYRDHDTLEPVEYYKKFPDLTDRDIIVLDPMLATGGSASAAITYLKARGVEGKNIKLVCVVAAPEGVKRVTQDHPDVPIYAAALDRCLNERGYILPGLGDAGDRIFGTK